MWTLFICMGIQFGMCTEFVKMNYPSKQECVEARDDVSKTINKHTSGYAVCSPKQ
jgi:hypothetical protein